MDPYHKIPTLWKRDPETKYKTLIENEWALPVFTYLHKADWLWYEKIDGTNIRVTYYPVEPLSGNLNHVGINGRTDRAQTPPFLLDVLEDMFPAEFFLDNFDTSKSGDSTITLYGEGFGKKIQKGGGNYGNPSFCLFDVKIGNMWMEQEFVSQLASDASLQASPLLGIGSLELAIDKAELGFNSEWGNFLAEGLILRPLVELQDRFGRRVIGKIKTKDFSLAPRQSEMRTLEINKLNKVQYLQEAIRANSEVQQITERGYE
jgi:hypothetical protein